MAKFYSASRCFIGEFLNLLLAQVESLYEVLQMVGWVTRLKITGGAFIDGKGTLEIFTRLQCWK